MWRAGVLGYDERREAHAICANVLNTTVARWKISKAERTVDAANLHLCGFPDKFQKVSISGFRNLQVDGETGTHTTPIDKYRGRSAGDEQISLFAYVPMSGEVPVFTGEAIRPKFPPSEWCASDANFAQSMARGGRREGESRRELDSRARPDPRVEGSPSPSEGKS